MNRPTPTPRPGFLARIWHAFDGLAADTLWSGGHDLFVLVQALTSFKLLQRSLEDIEYGAYIGAWGLIGSIGAITSGIGLALLQRLLGERDDPDSTLRSFLSLALLGSVAGSVFVVVLGLWTIDLTTAEVALMVTGELVALSVVTVSTFLIQAASGFQAAVRVRLVVVVARFVTVVALYAVGRLTILNLVAGYLLCFAGYAVYVLARHLPNHGYTVSFGVPSGLSVRASGTFSVPMAASKAQTDLDKFLVPAYGYKVDAALYGAAYRILQLGILPLLALDTAAFQRFLPKGDQEKGLHWRRATRLGALMVGASSIMAVLIYLLMPLFSALLLEDDFKDAIEIVPWLLPLMPLIATTNGPMNGLLGLGRAEVRMTVYLLAAGLAMVLYAILIPGYSWRGAVVATAISEVALSVMAWGALWHYQRRADEAIEGSAPAAVS